MHGKYIDCENFINYLPKKRQRPNLLIDTQGSSYKCERIFTRYIGCIYIKVDCSMVLGGENQINH